MYLLFRRIYLCLLFLYLVKGSLLKDYGNGSRRLSEMITEAKMGQRMTHLISIEIGTPPQKLELKLSTAICGIWILNKHMFKRGYIPENSGTLEALLEENRIDKVSGKVISDTIHLGDVELKEVPFLLVYQAEKLDKKKIIYDGLIGFGYKCKAKSVTNINLLERFANASGQKQIIGYQINHETQTGSVTLGKIPNDIDQQSRLYRISPVHQGNYNGHWEVDLHAVYFNDKFFSVHSSLSIGIGGTLISVTEKFFDFLLRDVFSNYIHSGVCEIHKDEVWEIFCDRDFNVNVIKDLSFIVGKWNFKINSKSLFRDVTINKNKKKWFAVVYYQKYNQWYISQNLFNSSIFVFNKETNSIGIFQNN